jgi:regulator of protease activity HflC (stomatin/prohibitin superfamily)
MHVKIWAVAIVDEGGTGGSRRGRPHRWSRGCAGRAGAGATGPVRRCDLRVPRRDHEWLGRYRRTLPAGRHWLTPPFETVRARVDLRPQVLQLRGIQVFAADDAVARIDLDGSFRVVDPVRSVYEIWNIRQAVGMAVVTALRNTLVGIDLAQARSDRTRVADELPGRLDPRHASRGVEVTRIELVALESA